MPNLFVVTREKPRLAWSEYFVLNPSSEANGRALTLVPPLPYKDLLYLSVTPRICATFDKDTASAKLLENEDYQLDETSANKFLEALKNAGPSVPAIRATGGKEEPGDRWDTWSGQSPREAPGILFAGRDVQFDFEALPFKQLPPQFDTTVFDELPLIRQYVDLLGAEMLIVENSLRLVLDYTWKTCNTGILYIQSVREVISTYYHVDDLANVEIS